MGKLKLAAWPYLRTCLKARVDFPLLPLLAAGFLYSLAVSNAQEASEEKVPPPDIFSLSLEEIKALTVVGASKREQTTAEAPASISILTQDDVKKFGYRTLADLLQSGRGMHVTYDRSSHFLGARGFNRGDFNSRVLILVDGHRMNNNLSDGGAIGTDFLLDVDLIDRVEIIRGPGSVLYGNNAFFGVVNVRTKQGADFNTAELSGEFARFDTYKGRATYGQRFPNDIDLLLSGSLYESEGPDSLSFREFGSPLRWTARGADEDQFKNFFGKIRYRDLTLTGGIHQREKGNPTSPFGTALESGRTGTGETRSYADLLWTRELPAQIEFSARLYYDRFDFSGDLFFDQPAPVLNRETQSGEWWGGEVQANKEFWDRLVTTLGVEYRDDFRQGRRNADIEPPSAILGRDERTAENYGVFWNNDLALRENLHLHAGFRYDQYEEVEARANPRVALVYNPWEQGTFKAIYGTAFRAPNFFERILQSPGRPLDPETIATYELIYEQQWGEQTRSWLGAFYNEIDDLISLQNDPAGGVAYRNIPGALARGLELEIERAWEFGLRAGASYTWQETEDRVAGQRLSDSPEHLVKMRLSVPVWREKVFAGVEYQYTGHRLTLFQSRAGGFGLANFTLFSQELIEGLEASVTVYNLFNNKFEWPATPFHRQDVLESDGRSFRLKLTYQF